MDIGIYHSLYAFKITIVVQYKVVSLKLVFCFLHYLGPFSILPVAVWVTRMDLDILVELYWAYNHGTLKGLLVSF